MRRFLTATVLSLAMMPALASAAGGLPTWDKAIGSPAGRFKIALGGAAYLDKETGLVWDANPPQSTYVTFNGAQAACATKVIGGRAGWRVPTVEELSSLLVPTIPPSMFTYTTDYYWTATTVAGTPTSGWVIFMGSAPTPFSKGNSELVWCVRGGNGYDAY